MKTFIKYLHLWLKLTENSFLISLTSKFNAVIFLLGKILRFGLTLGFIFVLFGQTKKIDDFNVIQFTFFFLTYTVIDTITQLFFREVYRFRPMVVSGDFDLVLVKPMNPLFRALAGGADPLDLLMLIPYIAVLIYVAGRLGTLSILHVVLYLLLIANGLLIATAFHILVLALAIVTTEIDHAVMIYRDLTSMGRVPIDIYREPMRTILTFVIPVGVMMTVPAKAFLGLLSPWVVIISFILGVLFFFICFRIWKVALTKYASASS
jgi:ABC-2 type transport system permease protein